MISENKKIYYVLIVDGKEVGVESESKHVVDLAKSQLNESQKESAEIITRTADGKQVLWG